MQSIGPYTINEIYLGDARELAKELPDNSFDIIFTDPPYKREFLYLYEWLARTATRILKPGGFLCAMAGGYYLDKVFEAMSNKGLDWYFKIEVYTRGSAPVIYPRRIVTRTKPILMWTKGKGLISTWNMTDIYQGQGPDKRYHLWGQDVGSAHYVISYITGGKPAILLEPFVGGGATLEACKTLGVGYVAFDIDPKAVQSARGRMKGITVPTNTNQKPLFS